MRLICFWCLLVSAARAQTDYYAPQTFRQNLDGYQSGLFTPAAAARDESPQSTSQSWTSAARATWGGASSTGPAVFPKQDPWRLPYPVSKEQQAHILHHKQALTSDGAFRFEYASDNGLAAGEQIEPDGSRVGAYQYKDPSGQLVKLKYRAGKEGFQILEGSHLPKSPEPVAPQNQEYQHAYAQQKQQYELQQQYNQQRPEAQQKWTQAQGAEEGKQKGAGGQYFNQNWSQQPGGPEDDGQYRENDAQEKGPHTFGTGYAFSFQG